MTFKEFARQHLDLKTIRIFNAKGLSDLKGIGEFEGSTALEIGECQELTSIDELPPNIERLEIIKCRSITKITCKIPDSLKVIQIKWCDKLESISDFSECSMNEFDVENCKSLKVLPKLPDLIKYVWLKNSGIEKFADDFDFNLDILNCDFSNTPIGDKYNLETLTYKENETHFDKLKVLVHLEPGNDLRGAASIMDTGLFDFKTN